MAKHNLGLVERVRKTLGVESNLDKQFRKAFERTCQSMGITNEQVRGAVEDVFWASMELAINHLYHKFGEKRAKEMLEEHRDDFTRMFIGYVKVMLDILEGKRAFEPVAGELP